MRKLDRLIAFDQATGELTCEAGVILGDLLDVFIPRGWFPTVTPGTKFVTIGGMVASDVHGKNHHIAGSFCDHVVSLQLALAGDRIVFCSRTENSDIFSATCGGMGLTGLILQVTFRLMPMRSAKIVQETIRAPALSDAFEIFEAGKERTYSVAWIDCLASGANLGRSLVMLGEHAELNDLPAEDRGDPFKRRRPPRRRVPVDFPGIALNRWSVTAFNKVYYELKPSGRALVDIEPYFYPLDALEDWNRIYGRRGFVQYQCVLPAASSRDGLKALLNEVARAGNASFLAVLKRLGKASFGLLSFPLDGYTLALDFPASPDTFKLLERLDAILLEAGGRVYLAKDSRMTASMMAASYATLENFHRIRDRYEVRHRVRSALSDRLGL